jgi:hypothetical protein
MLPSIGKTETMHHTPSQAQTLIEKTDFGAQRRLRKKRVEGLLDQMQTGKWSSGANPGIRFILNEENGVIYNIDGQHTLHAISRYESPVEVDTRYDVVSNREEVAIEYSKHDRQLTRSSKDNIQAFGLDEEFPLSMTDLSSVSAAVSFIRGDLRTNNHIPLNMHEHVLDVREWAPYMSEYKDCYDGCPGDFREKMLRMPVAACALVTLRYQPEVAKKFWYGVAWSEGGFYDPRRRLRRYLEKYNLRGGGDTVGPQIGRAKMARAIERAWVYYFEGRGELKVIQAGNDSRPVRFVGTPFHPDNN